MDASVTRRGQPCWYKKVTLDPRPENDLFLVLQYRLVTLCVCFQDGIGLDAINDSFLLEGSIYRLLRRHCRGQPYYIHLLELFMEVVQILDAQLSTRRHSDGILKPFLFGSDIVPNRARPGSGPYDCPPWTD